MRNPQVASWMPGCPRLFCRKSPSLHLLSCFCFFRISDEFLQKKKPATDRVYSTAKKQAEKATCAKGLVMLLSRQATVSATVALFCPRLWPDEPKSERQSYWVWQPGKKQQRGRCLNIRSPCNLPRFAQNTRLLHPCSHPCMLIHFH